MDLTAPDLVKRAISNLDLEAAADEATKVARRASTTALKLSRSTVRDVRKLARQHPQATAAIGGGLVVLGVVGLISWLRD
ncbi:MAG: hypothetical protein JNG84_08645 [Archangium sp.]|nr:hypothetical protein [Archangium sp.]